MALSLTDGRTGRRRSVRPGRPGPVTVYVCGPTVNGPAHVGHARTYLYFDVARRQLEADGTRVRTVMNITDYEDKISDRATALGTTWRAVARASERGFRSDLAALGIEPPEVVPRASEHVPAMREAIRRLVRLGRTVRRDGGLYFEPDPREPRTGAIGAWARRHAVPEGDGRPPDAAAEPEEFGLWLPPHPGGPGWPSPWGRGTPGWHVECFAMARRYLGFPVDLHGGGRDLAYPHHFGESELARTLERSAFARTYLYAEFVTRAGRKMSKSTGELVALRAALASGGPEALRFYLLGRPRSEPLAWDEAHFQAAGSQVGSIQRSFAELLEPGGGGTVRLAKLRALAQGVARELANDLGTDRALERIRAFHEELGRADRPRLPRGARRTGQALVRDLGSRLGIDWTPAGGRPRRTPGRSVRARRAG